MPAANLHLPSSRGLTGLPWAPRSPTEDGTDSSLGRLYGAKTLPTKSYRARTFRNVQESDGTIWFGSTDWAGAKATTEACELWHKPVLLVTPSEVVLPSDVVQWLRQNPQIKRLNLAGNRESKSPGIGARVERFLIGVFKRLADDLTPEASF
jgi:hypothetical protein